MSYAHALHRLRTLTLAHNALSEVLETATEDVIIAADAEARSGTAVTMVMRGRNESGTYARVSGSATSLPRVRSFDIERYLREAWLRAQTEEARVKVRDMTRSAQESLDVEATERLRRLIG